MRIVVVMIALLAGVMFTSAQDAPDATTCDAEFTLTLIAEFLAAPDLTPLDILHRIAEAAQEAIIACEGYTFTSENEGRNPVLGPVSLTEGLWRLSAETGGSMFMDLTVLSGVCEGTGQMASMGTLVMLVQPGDGAQTLIESEGCEALFEFSMVSADWTMTLEKLR